MYVRLGFAVAVNVEPDVLLVDEVLAVGDAAFQRKCLDHVKKFQQEGRTIVVVSHGTDTIRQNCERVMVMNHGQVITVDEPGEGDPGVPGRPPGRRHPRQLGDRRDRGQCLLHRHRAGRAWRDGHRHHLYPGESLTIDRRAGQPGRRCPTPWPPSPSTTTRTSWSSPPTRTTRLPIEVPGAAASSGSTFAEVPLLDGTYSVSVGIRSLAMTRHLRLEGPGHPVRGGQSRAVDRPGAVAADVELPSPLDRPHR